ncbi:trypsin I-P1-like [Brachionichthys hirsutus]|uniref:trypsin I-P1-like n=1 Tax=Brachionichthys hirsutus TaxID=412623 RepID=UPI0036048764
MCDEDEAPKSGGLLPLQVPAVQMCSRGVLKLQLSAVLLLPLWVPETFPARIIGGQEVPPHSVRYQASLWSRYGHYCGGTLVDRQWVVSAAHCWRPRHLMWVVLSEHNIKRREGSEQIFGVSKIVVNRYYNYLRYDNDIMLIKLSRAARLNGRVQPVSLPDATTPKMTKSTSCTVSGWGLTRGFRFYLSPVLRAVDVEIIPSCGYHYSWRITKNMLCAGSQWGGKDSCQGDSGGPLVCQGRLEGVVSWGIGCALPYLPGVYTKVRNYVPWIRWVINHA